MNLQLRSHVPAMPNVEAYHAEKDYRACVKREAERTAAAMATPATRAKAATLPFMFTTPMSNARQDTLRKHMTAAVPPGSRPQKTHGPKSRKPTPRQMMIEKHRDLLLTASYAEIARVMGASEGMAYIYARAAGRAIDRGQAKRNARIDTAMRMHQDGYRKDEIAAAMKITQKTVTRYLKDASLRESGQEAAA